MNPIFVRQTGRALGRLMDRTETLSSDDLIKLNEDVGSLFQTLEWAVQMDEYIEVSAEVMQRLHHFVESRGYAAQWLPLLLAVNQHPKLPDRQRLLLANQLCNFYRCREKYQLATQVGTDAAKEAAVHDFADIEMRLHYNLALAYQEARNIERAEHHIHRSQAIFEQTQSDHPFLTVNLPNLFGVIKVDKGDYKQAYSLFEEARQLAVITEQPQFLGWTIGNLGWAALRNRAFQTALGHFHEARSFANNHGDPGAWFVMSLNIGSTHIEMREPDLALKAFGEANTDYIRRFGTIRQRAMIATSVGHAYLNSGDCDAAGRYLTEAVTMWEIADDQVELAYANGLLGMQQAECGNKLDAIELLEKAIVLLMKPIKAGQSQAKEHHAMFQKSLSAIRQNA